MPVGAPPAKLNRRRRASSRRRPVLPSTSGGVISSWRCRPAWPAMIRSEVRPMIQPRSSAAVRWRVPRIGQERTMLPVSSAARDVIPGHSGDAQGHRMQRSWEVLSLHGSHPLHGFKGRPERAAQQSLAGQPQPGQDRAGQSIGHATHLTKNPACCHARSRSREPTARSGAAP